MRFHYVKLLDIDSESIPKIKKGIGLWVISDKIILLKNKKKETSLTFWTENINLTNINNDVYE